MKHQTQIEQLSETLIKMLFDAGYDYNGVLKIIELAREIFNTKKTI